MSPKEVLRLPGAMIDSLIIYPIESFVIRSVVKGLQTLDDSMDVWDGE